MQEKQRHKAQRINITKQNNTMSRPKLKPCPFCGSTVVTNLTRAEIRFFDCGGCGAKTSFVWANENEAINAWNARTEESYRGHQE